MPDSPSLGDGTAGPSLSIVLGTLNERMAIPDLIDRIEALELPPHEVIVVDDGSTDGTREYVQGRMATDPHLRLLVNGAPRTLIPAQSEWVEAARGEFDAIMDSDMQHPPEKIPDVYRQLSAGADLVIASRYRPTASTGDRSTFRSVISRGAEFIVRIVIPEARPVSDPMSGFYGFRRSLFHSPAPMHRGYHMLPYLLILCAGRTIKEVPYTFGHRLSGASKVTQNFGFVRIFLSQMLITMGIRSALRGRARARTGVAPDASQKKAPGARSDSPLGGPSSPAGISGVRR